MESRPRHRARGIAVSSMVAAVLAAFTLMFAGVSARAVFTTIHDFMGSPTDGSEPYSTTVVDPATGNLYGTTSTGGKFGLGVVYCITPGFGVTIIHNFSGPDGAKPTCTLILEPSATKDDPPNLFGTTLLGGKSNKGVVFKVSITGTPYVKLHDFIGGGNDGANPFAGVIQASDGLLYGTTLLGGNANDGTTYRLQKSGLAYTMTHIFTGLTPGIPPDGAHPYGRLLEWKPGVLVGTTAEGGKADFGTVFTEHLAGGTYGLLHAFLNTPDGAHPASELILLVSVTGAPLLWGTAFDGGSSSDGLIYSIAPGGAPYTVEYSFTGGADGANPFGGLFADGTPQMIYGTTVNGGPGANGVVYTADPNGPPPIAEALLHPFAFGEGEHPYAALMLPAAGGDLVSSTRDGGQLFDGTLFEQSP